MVPKDGAVSRGMHIQTYPTEVECLRMKTPCLPGRVRAFGASTSRHGSNGDTYPGPRAPEENPQPADPCGSAARAKREMPDAPRVPKAPPNEEQKP
jgi:hypothetical protein